MTEFTPGSLVAVRGRDWIVLPNDDRDVLRLRPLTSAQEAEEGVFLPLEGSQVKPAQFDWPNPNACGDASGVMALFDAARLSLRSGAAPFRSLGRISVVPRPYQFVPLIMALRLDPVRLLIADDVGVGKTIEAGMLARELLDRGIGKRLGVLCPAHLADQWERELREKFVIDTARIQPANFLRLERALPRSDQSVYAHYPHLVASIDYVKSPRHKPLFLADAPDIIIVDEAHMAARPPSDKSTVIHQRYELLRELAVDPKRHIILVTATPHSGVDESFRSLLGLLNGQFDTGASGRGVQRDKLVPHIVQRKRSDVEDWLGTDTPFPERINDEGIYELHEEYRQLFVDVLQYCREAVQTDAALRESQQRVRHWAAIALLRCLLSSPQTAATVLENRQRRLEEQTNEEAENPSAEEVDEQLSPQVLDELGDASSVDYAPTAPFDDETAKWSASERRRLREFRRRAEALLGPEKDTKLAELAEKVKQLLKDGFRPIIFCRFIPTAHYLAKQLPELVKGRGLRVQYQLVTGEVGDEERRARINELVEHDCRILIATDCLSEGINLQVHFDAVVHYDLPWNPNRLEQREGRVDRYGQIKAEVRTTLIWGRNNDVDQVVLEVLVRKAREIRNRLGIAVPAPLNSDEVISTIVDTVLLRGTGAPQQLDLGLGEEHVGLLHGSWDEAANREQAQRGFFAQSGVQPDEVQKEIEATDHVLGDSVAVQRFLGDAVQRFGGSLRESDAATFRLSTGDLRGKLGEFLAEGDGVDITFDRLKDENSLYIGRTHPLVERVCDSVLGDAFANKSRPGLARAGAMVTSAVGIRTAILLLRFRYLFAEKQRQEFAEEVVLAAFSAADGKPEWLEPLDAEPRALVERAEAVANLSDAERATEVSWALSMLDADPRWFQSILDWRQSELEQAHERLRAMSGAGALTIDPKVPPDILGCFVLLPGGGS